MGSGDGQFIYPRAICVNSRGEIIVADSSNHRIQIFNKEGRFQTKFGSQGEQSKQFHTPHGIAVDDDDNIYVADSFNHRIQIFNADGTELFKVFGKQGKNDGEFDIPRGIYVDHLNDGNILVTDSGNDRVQVFNKNGQFIRKFGKGGAGKREMQSPYGIVVNARNEIIVSEPYNHRLQVFDYHGNHLRFIANDKGESFHFPYHLSVVRNYSKDDKDNNLFNTIFVANFGKKEIIIVDSVSGQIIHAIKTDNYVCAVFFDSCSQLLYFNAPAHSISVV